MPRGERRGERRRVPEDRVGHELQHPRVQDPVRALLLRHGADGVLPRRQSLGVRAVHLADRSLHLPGLRALLPDPGAGDQHRACRATTSAPWCRSASASSSTRARTSGRSPATPSSSGPTSSRPRPPTAAVRAAPTARAAPTCTFAEEMTNFANWYAYYRSRILMMKTGTGIAFRTLDDRYRIGFITIHPGSPVAAMERLAAASSCRSSRSTPPRSRPSTPSSTRSRSARRRPSARRCPAPGATSPTSAPGSTRASTTTRWSTRASRTSCCSRLTASGTPATRSTSRATT